MQFLFRSVKLWKKFYSTQCKHINVQDELFLTRLLTQKIKATGPIPVAQYMKEVLTNSQAGYYMHHDVFGVQGDFITSPEITQMFGEMIAVWFLNEWQKIGSPKPLQIVELGPGRGTLSADILRVFNHFKCLHNVSLNLVEISPYLIGLQAKRLCSQSSVVSDGQGKEIRRGLSHEGTPVRWYSQLNDVPNAFTLLIAHEFFDALPIYKFHKTFLGYREILIDINNNKKKEQDPNFLYVVARNKTPMINTLIKTDYERQHLEISPDTILITQQICERLIRFGGIALICDYGHNGDGGDTFRAFKQHKQVDPLHLPGTADLTADVDFNIIKSTVEKNGGVICYGPVTQQQFLLKIGLQHRLENLSSKTTPENQAALKECYHMLTDDDKMGSRFKFFSMFPETLKSFFQKFPVVGFS